MNNVEEQLAQEVYFLKYKYSSVVNLSKKLEILYNSLVDKLSIEEITPAKLDSIFVFIDKQYDLIFKETEGLSEEELLALTALFIVSEGKLLGTTFKKSLVGDLVSYNKDIVLGYKLSDMIMSVKGNSKAKLKNIIKANVNAKEDIKKYKSDMKNVSVNYSSDKVFTALSTYSKFLREKTRNVVEKKSALTGWISLAVLDGKTSAICVSLNKEIYTIDKYKVRSNIPNLPPRHFNCRSVVIRTTDMKRDLIDSGITFNSFLKSNSKVGVNLLGKKKYDLFIKGDYDIKSFISGDGNWFTLKELEKIL